MRQMDGRNTGIALTRSLTVLVQKEEGGSRSRYWEWNTAQESDRRRAASKRRLRSVQKQRARHERDTRTRHGGRYGQRVPAFYFDDDNDDDDQDYLDGWLSLMCV